MDADNQQATVMNLLVAHENMDDKTAYNIVKTIFEHKRRPGRACTRKRRTSSSRTRRPRRRRFPWHPGAIKYFAEQGVKLK